MAEVFRDQNDHDRHDEQNRVSPEFGVMEVRQTEPGGVADQREIDRLAETEAVCKNRVDHVGNEKADENQKLLDEAAGVDRDTAHTKHGKNRDPGVEGRGADALAGGRGEVKTDHRDHCAGHNRRHQLFNPGDTGQRNDDTHKEVHDAAGHDAAERDLDIGVEAGTGRIARGRDHDADEGERRTEVARHTAAHHQEEDEGADAAHQYGNVGVKAHQNRGEDGGTEHGDNVLNAERDRLVRRQGFIRRDDAGCFYLPFWKITHGRGPLISGEKRV